MMNHQPNFSDLFFALGESFRLNEQRKYVIRPLPQMVHDIMFLSSLIHDATFQGGSVELDPSGLLSVPLKRDTWEQFRATGKLDSISSRLEFAGIVNSDEINLSINEGEFMVEYLWVSEDCRIDSKPYFTVSIVGHDWRQDLKLDRVNFSIVLIDL